MISSWVIKSFSMETNITLLRSEKWEIEKVICLQSRDFVLLLEKLEFLNLETNTVLFLKNYFWDSPIVTISFFRIYFFYVLWWYFMFMVFWSMVSFFSSGPVVFFNILNRNIQKGHYQRLVLEISFKRKFFFLNLPSYFIIKITFYFCKKNILLW